LQKSTAPKTNDVLESVMRLLDIHDDEYVYVLNDAQIVAIEEAREDYRNGRILTNEEVEKEIKEFFNNQSGTAGKTQIS
jgi:hypothetical protein